MKSSSFYCVLAFMLALIVIVQSAVTPDESDEKRAHNIMRFGRGHSIMRFGRAGHNIMHFGKRGDGSSDESAAAYASQGYGPAEYQLPMDQSALEALLSSYSPSYNKKASDPRELRERDNVFMHFG